MFKMLKRQEKKVIKAKVKKAKESIILLQISSEYMSKFYFNSFIREPDV